jgi:hypothetical protein
LFFSFALDCIIKKVQEHQAGLKWNRIYQLLIYADDLHLFGDQINAIKENKEPTIYTGSNAGLEVNLEKTEYMLMCCHQNSG